MTILKYFYQKLNVLLNFAGFEIRRKNRFSQDMERNLYMRYYGEESLEKKKFYNVGAGSFRHFAWQNIDKRSDWYSSVQDDTSVDYDLFELQPLPVDDDSAEIIYTSHTVEHITNSAAQNLFNESYRALKKGGILRVTTPNIDLYYRAYKENDWDFFYFLDTFHSKQDLEDRKYTNYPLKSSLHQVFLCQFAHNVSTLHTDGAKERIQDDELIRLFEEMEYEDALEYCTSKCDIELQKKYPGNHINWWNFNKMKRLFEIAGFKEIYLSAYGQSFSPVLRNTDLFDNTHPKISLYVEARK